MRVQLWRNDRSHNTEDTECGLCLRIIKNGHGTFFSSFEYEDGKIISSARYCMCTECSRLYLRLIKTQKRNGAPNTDSWSTIS